MVHIWKEPLRPRYFSLRPIDKSVLYLSINPINLRQRRSRHCKWTATMIVTSTWWKSSADFTISSCSVSSYREFPITSDTLCLLSSLNSAWFSLIWIIRRSRLNNRTLISLLTLTLKFTSPFIHDSFQCFVTSIVMQFNLPFMITPLEDHPPFTNKTIRDTNVD